jgi:quercetin dioxygenase-like cupin family protein
MLSAVAKRSTVEGPWRPVRGREDVSVATLNEDPETRGSTLVVKLAAGYEAERSLHDATVEVVVLEGRWQTGAITYGPGEYFCVPGGVVHGPERALTDVRLLVIAHGPLTPGP